MTIRNPIEWSWDQIRQATHAAELVGQEVRETQTHLSDAMPVVRRINSSDLRDALARGWQDFKANRTDVITLCIIYPLAGIVFGRLMLGYEMVPLLFPLAAGFALVGPVAAIGLYELSRRRELGHDVGWADAFGVFRSPSFGAVFFFGLILMALFGLWMTVAAGLYDLTLGRYYLHTLGPEPQVTFGMFLHDVFTTGPGWVLIVLGIGIGFLFAVVVLAIGSISFPMLLDRNVALETAVWTSVRAIRTNPSAMAQWGLIVAAGLVLGSIPLLVGLAVVLPVLGHGTWHLYRKLVP